jgi:hypothetical protein
VWSSSGGAVGALARERGRVEGKSLAFFVFLVKVEIFSSGAIMRECVGEMYRRGLLELGKHLLFDIGVYVY